MHTPHSSSTDMATAPPIIPQYTDEGGQQIFKVRMDVPVSKRTRNVKYILKFGKLPPKRSIVWAPSNDVQTFQQYLGRTSAARPLRKRRVTPHPQRLSLKSASRSFIAPKGTSQKGAESSVEMDDVQTGLRSLSLGQDEPPKRSTGVRKGGRKSRPKQKKKTSTQASTQKTKKTKPQKKGSSTTP